MYTSGSFQPRNVYSIHKRHPYTGNLNTETSGDSKDAFLHCGDVLVAWTRRRVALVAPDHNDTHDRGSDSER